MHPTHYAKVNPDKLALIVPHTGEQLTYGELEAMANQGARVFQAAGLQPGDTVAILSDNCLDYYVAWWAAQRSGMYFNGLPTAAPVEETQYVIRDCGARLLILSCALGESAKQLVREAAVATPTAQTIYTIEGALDGVPGWREAVASMPSGPLDEPRAGTFQAYSSGSTGRPKGLRRGLPEGPFDKIDPIMKLWLDRFSYSEDAVYLAPGPLAHTLTLSFSHLAQRIGATVVQMHRFDPVTFLQLVEKYRVTNAQMVPMMFVKLLKTPEEVRARYDVSSLRAIVHSAAPCPPDVKRAMIDWWGPILHEFYSGSEGWGCAIITSEEWLQRPGSVGKPAFGIPHICDETGREAPPGEIGTIYFEGRNSVYILNDPVRTEQMRHPEQKTWGTFGDVGYMDDEGYLYLTDRVAFVTRSGGVKLYPQETEDLLIAHPKVVDAAVFGVPDADLGERLTAIVRPLSWDDAGPALAKELHAYCQSRLPPEKRPAAIEFEPALPRSESGKLYKRQLLERYRAA